MVPSCLLVSNAEFGGAECVGEERERGGRERWDMERDRERERVMHVNNAQKKKLQDSNHSRNAFYFLVLIRILIQI